MSFVDEEHHLVPLCHDHFARLAKGDVCSQCPSRVENEVVVLAMAKLFEEDQKGALKATVTEIQSIRRLQSQVQNKIEDMESQLQKVARHETALFGLDGGNGIRSELKIMEREIAGLKRAQFIAIGALFILQLFAVPILLHLLT